MPSMKREIILKPNLVIFKGFSVFICFLFCFIETGSHHAAHSRPGTCHIDPAGLELTWAGSCLCLPCAGIKGKPHHAQLISSFQEVDIKAVSVHTSLVYLRRCSFLSSTVARLCRHDMDLSSPCPSELMAKLGGLCSVGKNIPLS